MMISVCIASFNGEKYIRQQLESILLQLGSNDEIVISDDGSTDKTIAIVKSIADDRIKVVYNQSKHGFTPNFQNAICHAKGDVIFTADQDDVWFDNKIDVCCRTLSEYDLVVTDATVVNGDLKLINESYWSIRRPFFTLLGNWLKCGHLGCCLAFRRNMLDKLLPFPLNYKKCPHDLWIVMIGLAFYKTKFIKTPLMYYRRHGNNTSNAGFKDETSLKFKISYRFYLLFQLLKRLGK